MTEDENGEVKKNVVMVMRESLFSFLRRVHFPYTKLLHHPFVLVMACCAAVLCEGFVSSSTYHLRWSIEDYCSFVSKNTYFV